MWCVLIVVVCYVSFHIGFTVCAYDVIVLWLKLMYIVCLCACHVLVLIRCVCDVHCSLVLCKFDH